jgi:hypothetical protein
MPARVFLLFSLNTATILGMRWTKKRKELLLLGGTALILWITGTTFYHFYKGMNWIDATYFTTMTLATVGYGDHVPVTPVGKMFTIVFVIVGITCYPNPSKQTHGAHNCLCAKSSHERMRRTIFGSNGPEISQALERLRVECRTV